MLIQATLAEIGFAIHGNCQAPGGCHKLTSAILVLPQRPPIGFVQLPLQSGRRGYASQCSLMQLPVLASEIAKFLDFSQSRVCAASAKRSTW